MPYCPSCNFWMPGRLRAPGGQPCANCGKEGAAVQPGTLVFSKNRHVLGALMFFSFMWAVCGFRQFPLVASGFFFVASIGFGVAFAKAVRAKQESKERSDVSQKAVFEELMFQKEKLNEQVRHLEELHRSESTEVSSPRGKQRVELLGAVLRNRQQKVSLMETELWARDIQLWLNQLEGFLAESLVQLNRQNGDAKLNKLRYIIMQGGQLLERGKCLPQDTLQAQQATRLLTECLSRAPDLEERVRDARVLAAVGEGPELPPELSEGKSWLHWIQDAIPTLDSLPEVLKVDEEYLRMNTELRLMRDGVKFVSLDPRESALTGTASSMDREL